MPSSRFRALRSNVKQLRKLLLPSKFSPTGAYASPMRVSMRTLSFRVLAHAEIETYFEERAVEIAKAAWVSWRSEQHPSRVLLHLLAYSGLATILPPDSLQAPVGKSAAKWSQEQTSIYDRLERSTSKYIKDVTNNNHGIKEKNVLSIILPLGFDVAKCDQLALTMLDQFGSARGAAAHSSAIGTVTRLVDPHDENATVQKILNDLLAFDAEFDRLLGIAKS